MVDREWRRLAAPGTWLTGAERVAVAAAARGEKSSSTPAERAARGIHDRPAELRREWLAGLEAEGLALLEYVEVLGIVARLRAVDTFRFGLGTGFLPLPEPLAGEPCRERVDEAVVSNGWVPTVGPAWPLTVLSSVPAENRAMEDVHSVLYLSATFDEKGPSMGNTQAVRDGLTRTQMEFVAARTSLLNDCFY